MKLKTIISLICLSMSMFFLWGCSQLSNLLSGNDANASSTTSKTIYDVKVKVIANKNLSVVTQGDWKIEGTSYSGTISSEGYIVVTDVKPGDYKLRVVSSGYVTANMSLALPEIMLDQEAIFIGGGDHYYNKSYLKSLILYSATTTLNITVYKGELLASNAVVDITWGSTSNIDFPQTYITDASGNIKIVNVPSDITDAAISVRPYDSNNDGIDEYNTTSVTDINLLRNQTVSVNVVLERNLGSTAIIRETNLGEIISGGSISAPRLTGNKAYFIFSQLMDTSSANTRITVQDNSSNAIPFTYEWVTPIRLEVTVASTYLNTGKTYSIGIIAFTTNSKKFNQTFSSIDWVIDRVGDIFSNVTATPSNLIIAPNMVDYNSTSLDLSWQGVANSGGYYIYAKNNTSQTKYLYVGKATAPVNDTSTANLGYNLDLTGTVFTPLKETKFSSYFAGQSLTFCVVPVNAANKVPDDTNYPSVTVSDNKSPEADTVYLNNSAFVPNGGVSADNTAITYKATTIQFQINFSEPVSSFPTISFSDTDTSNVTYNVVLSASSGKWYWLSGNDNKKAVYTIEVPAGKYAKGDLVTFDFTSIKDWSGNSIVKIATPAGGGVSGLTATANVQ